MEKIRRSVVYTVSLFIFLCGGSKLVWAQTRSSLFFEEKQVMLTGSYYYPEQWPESQWERDISNMARLGFEFTHYGEFAWSTLEPEEGKYNFDWLDKAVALAAKYHLKVVLCTPSATPPAWLTAKHPDVLMVNAEGRTIQHGARQQASWSSKVYREYLQKIVEALAKRYAGNAAVWGWQIDNEPSHYGAAFDYSANAQQSFRAWLQRKYGAIDTLNRNWGNAFWSQWYNSFEQIHIPNAKELVQQANPHAILDFKRFTADEAASFVLWQQQLLRKHIPASQWVTTNLMADYSPVDPLRFKDLDLVTYTKYLVAGFDRGHGAQGFRMGSSTSIGFANDLFRNINGISGVMELQPGQVNWGSYNPQTMPGTVRMWIYHVLAGGNQFVCNYRFREPLSGGEQYHYGIMKPDGVTVSRSGDEYVKVIGEIKTLRQAWKPGAVMPAALAKRKTAILYNPDNRWETEYQPQTDQWSFMDHLLRYYKATQSMAAPVDIITEAADFSGYPILIAPAYQLLDTQLVARWQQYVTAGGHLVLTSRTGQKDREAHLWEALFAQPIHQFTGIKEIFYDHLPADVQGTIRMNERLYKWNNWADVVSIKNAEVWATYEDQFYKGSAAVVSRKLGKGTVTYIGADSDDGLLERDVLQKVYTKAGIPVLQLPEGVVISWQKGFWIGLNYSSAVQAIPVPAGSKVLIGQQRLKPGEVVVWQE
jgi:beta-galactosidase